ncbi:MAG TPA: 3-deoxy-7-phosphoheptulonate synthase [Flavobacteriales bacterium]|jgi:chorismate mutase|nr:3-deoxy-7-phosphoheptulonate synthase [Flavobacteriales bacterium]
MTNTNTYKNWLQKITNNNQPLIIAGPCSAETEQQVLATAQGIKQAGGHIYRAGIWKPRTRPGNFEGVGSIGLKWIEKAKEQTGLLTSVEVANPHHVELALNHKVDILWIGARTSVNPFAVQEIADALKGVDTIVLVKNPINPDLALWIGALERFHKAGIENLGAIHRGFSSYKKMPYRNEPLWQIPIDLKTKFPDLPLINDPSHISGKRENVYDIAQTAIQLMFDGLMIETHIDPENAWSDARQQITPEYLEDIIPKFNPPKDKAFNPALLKSFKLLRKDIDQLDTELVQLLKERQDKIEAIARLKFDENIAIYQKERWLDILNKAIENAGENEVNQKFIEELFRVLHQESLKIQHRVFNDLNAVKK